MPKEYIERGAILDAIAEGHGKRNDTQEGTAIEIWDEIKKIPAANVVEVVRCKDCKHWKHEEDVDFVCARHYGYRLSTDFCSHAERKDEG